MTFILWQIKKGKKKDSPGTYIFFKNQDKKIFLKKVGGKCKYNKECQHENEIVSSIIVIKA